MKNIITLAIIMALGLVFNKAKAQSAAFTQGTIEVCKGTLFELDAGTGTSYFWSTGATTQTIEVGQSGYYTVQVFDEQGRSQQKDFDVVFQDPSVNLGGDQIICQGESITLSVPTYMASVEWVTPSGPQSGPSITVQEGGFYQVMTTTTAGCTFEDQIFISTIPKPEANLGPNIVVCQGEEVELTAPGEGQYLWQATNGGQVTNPQAKTIQVTQAGTYKLTITGSNGCQDTDQVNVTFLGKPTVSFSPPPQACPGDVVTLTATAQNGINKGPDATAIDNGTLTYLWSTGQTTPTIEVTQGGTYTVEVSNENGCVGSAQQEVRFENLTIDLPNVLEECQDEVYIYPVSNNELPQGAELEWRLPDGSKETGKAVILKQEGFYTLTITASNCTASKTFEVKLFPEPNITLPTEASLCNVDEGLVLDGGVANFYEWSTGETTRTIRVFEPGTYTLKASNNQKCQKTYTVKVEEPTQEYEDVTRVTCPADFPLVLTTPYQADTYTWANGVRNSPITIQENGTYPITLLKNGCIKTINVEVVPANVIIRPGQNFNMCLNEERLIEIKSNGTYFEWYLKEKLIQKGESKALTINQPGKYTIRGAFDEESIAKCYTEEIIEIGLDPELCPFSKYDKIAEVVAFFQDEYDIQDTTLKEQIEQLKASVTATAMNNKGWVAGTYFNPENNNKRIYVLKTLGNGFFYEIEILKQEELLIEAEGIFGDVFPTLGIADIADNGYLALNGRIPPEFTNQVGFYLEYSAAQERYVQLLKGASATAGNSFVSAISSHGTAASSYLNASTPTAAIEYSFDVTFTPQSVYSVQENYRRGFIKPFDRLAEPVAFKDAAAYNRESEVNDLNEIGNAVGFSYAYGDGIEITRPIPLYRYYNAATGSYRVKRLLNGETGQGWALNDRNRAAGWIYTIGPGGSTSKIRGFYQNLDCTDENGNAKFQLIREESIVSVRGLNNNDLVTGAYITSINIPDNPDTEEDETVNIPSTNRAYVFKGCGCESGGEFYDATEIVRQAYPELTWILRNSLAINDQNYIMGLAQDSVNGPLFAYRLYIPPCLTCFDKVQNTEWTVQTPYPFKQEALNGLDVVTLTIDFPNDSSATYTGQKLEELLVQTDFVFRYVGQHVFTIDVQCLDNVITLTRNVNTFKGLIPRPLPATQEKFVRNAQAWEGHVFEAKDDDYFLPGNKRNGKDLLIIQENLPYAAFFAAQNGKAYPYFEDEEYEFTNEKWFADVIVREIERYNKENPDAPITYDIITDAREMRHANFSRALYDYSAVWVNMEGMSQQGIDAYKYYYKQFDEYAKRRTLIVTAGGMAYNYTERKIAITDQQGNQTKWKLPLNIEFDLTLGADYETKKLIPGTYEANDSINPLLWEDIANFNVYQELEDLFNTQNPSVNMPFEQRARLSIESLLGEPVADNVLKQYYASTGLSLKHTDLKLGIPVLEDSKGNSNLVLSLEGVKPSVPSGMNQNTGVTGVFENFLALDAAYDDGRVVAFSNGLLWAAANSFLIKEENQTTSQQLLTHLISNLKERNKHNFITYPIAQTPIHIKDPIAFAVNDPNIDISQITWSYKRVKDETAWTTINDPERFFIENHEHWGNLYFKAEYQDYTHILHLPVAKWGVWVMNQDGTRSIYRKGEEGLNTKLNVDKESGKMLVIIHGWQPFNVHGHGGTIGTENRNLENKPDEALTKKWVEDGYTVVELDWVQMADNVNLFDVEKNIWSEDNAAQNGVPWRKRLRGVDDDFFDVLNLGWGSDEMSLRKPVADYLSAEFKDFFNEFYAGQEVPLLEFRVLAHSLGSQVAVNVLHDWLVETEGTNIDRLKDECVSKQLDLADYFVTLDYNRDFDNKLRPLVEEYDLPVVNYRTSSLKDIAQLAQGIICFQNTGALEIGGLGGCLYGLVVNVALAGVGKIATQSMRVAYQLYKITDRVNDLATFWGQFNNIDQVILGGLSKNRMAEVFVHTPEYYNPVSSHQYAHAFYLANKDNGPGKLFGRELVYIPFVTDLLELNVPALVPSSCAELIRRYRGYSISTLTAPSDFFNTETYESTVTSGSFALQLLKVPKETRPFAIIIDEVVEYANQVGLIEQWNGFYCEQEAFQATPILSYYADNDIWDNQEPQEIKVDEFFKDKKLAFFYGFQPPGKGLQWVELKCQGETDCPENFRFEPTLITLNGQDYYKPPVGTMWLRAEYNCGQNILFDQVPVQVLDVGLYFKEENTAGRNEPLTPKEAPFNFFDADEDDLPNEEVLVFIGGWAKGLATTGQRDFLERKDQSLLTGLAPDMTAMIWHYSPFADTELPGYLQEKIAGPLPAQGLEWIDQKGDKHYINNGQTLTDYLVADLTELYNDLPGTATSKPKIRLVGHGLGAQLAIEAANQMGQGQISRVALINPIWLGNDRYQDLLTKATNIVQEKQVLMEWYQSTDFDSDGGNDNDEVKENPAMQNSQMKALAAVIKLAPEWVNQNLWNSSRSFTSLAFANYSQQDHGKLINSSHAAAVDYYFKGYFSPNEADLTNKFPLIYYQDFEIMRLGGYSSISATFKGTLKPVELNMPQGFSTESLFEKMGPGLNAGTCARSLYLLTGMQLIQGTDFSLKSGDTGQEIQVPVWKLYAPDETADKVTEAQEN